MQPASLAASLQALLRPAIALGLPSPLPTLASLPLPAQARLLLLARAAPQRFPAAQLQQLAESLGAAAGQAAPPSLVQLLAAELLPGVASNQAAVPPCPSFLYTGEPYFPWAPRRDAAAAAEAAARASAHKRAGGEGAAWAGSEGSDAKRQRQAAAAGAEQQPQPQTQQGGASELEAATATVRAALGASGQAAVPEVAAAAEKLAEGVPPHLRAALDMLLARAVATGSSAALLGAGLGALGDDRLLLLLLTELLPPSSSHARSCAAAGGLLLPRLAGLRGPAPRDLAAAVQHLGGWGRVG